MRAMTRRRPRAAANRPRPSRTGNGRRCTLSSRWKASTGSSSSIRLAARSATTRVTWSGASLPLIRRTRRPAGPPSASRPSARPAATFVRGQAQVAGGTVGRAQHHVLDATHAHQSGGLDVGTQPGSGARGVQPLGDGGPQAGIRGGHRGAGREASRTPPTHSPWSLRPSPEPLSAYPACTPEHDSACTVRPFTRRYDPESARRHRPFGLGLGFQAGIDSGLTCGLES